MSRSRSTRLANRARRHARRIGPHAPRAGDDGAVLIRHASPADAGEIERLSELDEHALPQGERLVGEREGRLVAAVDVRSGAAIADPFVPTAGVVELLWLRAAQVR